MNRPLKIIGRLARIDFPDWKFHDIEAKVDTGAYTSSLHCHDIELTSHDDIRHVRFRLLDPSHEEYRERFIELPVYRRKSVKSSNGTTENRIFIQTEVHLYGETFTADFSLTDRSEMRHPVLLGRKLLKGRFLVDVSRKNFTVTPTSEKPR